MKLDAIIVGGGPSGSAAAIRLATAGSRVLLVDRSSFPRDKACGDGLFPEAVRLVESLGIDLGEAPRISRVVTKSTSGNATAEFELRNSYPGAVVPRQFLDGELLRAASKAGAEVRQMTTAESLVVDGDVVRGVRMRTPNGALETALAPVTILGEGSVGSLRRQAPVRQATVSHVCFAARRYWHGVEFPGESHSFEMHFPLEALGIPIVGYGWVFPVGDGLANVGAGYFSRPQSAPNLRVLLREFERKLVLRDPRFAHAEPIGRAVGAPIRIGGSARSNCGAGILAVGDCAGVANPFTGEGISQALTTGGLAASAVIDHLETGSDLDHYGASLLRWNRTYDRLSDKLTQAHQSTAHLSREIIPMFGRSSSVARSVFRMLETEVRSSKSASSISADSRVEELARIAVDRAVELSSRERPFFSDLIREMLQLPDCPPPLATVYYSIRTAGCQHLDLHDDDHRIARSLELLRIATFAIDSVEIRQLSSTDDSRGGDWAESYFTLGLADRVLARMFSQLARLRESSRIAASREVRGAYHELASLSLDRLSPDEGLRNRLLVHTAARVALHASNRSSHSFEWVRALADEYARTKQSISLFRDQFDDVSRT